MSTNSPLTAPRPIELLSPARDVETAVEAINHGADAVYIGGPQFGARQEAANSLSDLRPLVDYAHFFGARVYVTLNTILYDSELAEARDIACSLAEMGVDALLVQDAAFLSMDLPPIALHASTQMDNRDADKVQRLGAEGFSTVVLARELGIPEIRAIHEACPAMRLEAFVHGALCVSLSGRCYASQHCFSRSANRGACAQFCRLPFDLITDDGRKLIDQKHLLSLRDMNRSAYLEQMMDAGVSSFKIEGRLKDTAYVKNITAWYRRLIDAILERREDYCRASAGVSEVTFEPRPEKSFNRGFTDYFFPAEHMANISTPKNIGESVGEVRLIKSRSILVSGHVRFSAGDGLCYFTSDGRLEGFRVNRAEGMELFPYRMPLALRPHTRLFRNHDAAFTAALAVPTATRTLSLDMTLLSAPDGYLLKGRDERGRSAEVRIDFPYQAARTPQEANIRSQLSKLGGTGYRAGIISIADGTGFIPSSLLSTARRGLVDALRAIDMKPERTAPVRRGDVSFPSRVDYSANVSNKEAAAYYHAHGAATVEPAWEVKEPGDAPIMTCRYCVRRELGICLKQKDSPREPLALRLADGRRFPLQFDCRRCYMKVYAAQ